MGLKYGFGRGKSTTIFLCANNKKPAFLLDKTSVTKAIFDKTEMARSIQSTRFHLKKPCAVACQVKGCVMICTSEVSLMHTCALAICCHFSMSDGNDHRFL